MIGRTRRMRRDTISRTCLVGLALFALTACSDDSTSPSPASAVSLVVTAGASQSGTVATSLATPIVIQVLDGTGNPVPGVSVSFAPSSTSGAVSVAQGVTDATGSVQVSWTLGTIAGMDSLVVTSGSLPSIVVAATATAGAPIAINIVAGNDQAATAGSSLALPLAVKVVDQYGNGVPNATITWSDDAGGTLASTSTVTDANGMAQDAYTLGSNAGPEDITAALTLPSASTLAATFLEDGM